MKTIIKLNNYDLDIPINDEFGKNIRIGDVLCVYDFENELKPTPDWVIEFIGDEYDDEDDSLPVKIFPVDMDYVEENRYFKLKVTEREFRGEELILWVDIASNNLDSPFK